ncbi:MAG: hypothetical protein ACYCXA_01585 [Actinomycetes bacterium]
MTVHDLACDRCGARLAGITPGGAGAGTDVVPPALLGVRFVYHPGDPDLRDNSGLVCPACWATLTEAMGMVDRTDRCAVCEQPVTRHTSLHLHRYDTTGTWRLCAGHAVAFLNDLRTVAPLLDPETFRFPLAGLDQ